jgi:GTP-binding protein
MIDEVVIKVTSGKGGNGTVSGRRERYVPLGGPDGGDGGDGGSVYARCDENVNTLLSFRYKRNYRAGSGGGGMGKKQHGKKGEDIEIVVPAGTELRDGKTNERIADLTVHDERVLIASGGKGGRGNTHFTSSTNQFPLLAEEGDPGLELELRLELKLLADVGIVGAPNAGKSSLLAAVSAARPKVANYPFTTLEPLLGVVQYGDDGFVMVDIPGLIEGAHAGVGLGDEFLRHIERTSVLVHVIDGNVDDPLEEYQRIRNEMRLFNEELMDRPEIVAVNKRDIPDVEDVFEWVRDDLAKDAVAVHCISAVGRIGLDELLRDVSDALAEAREQRQYTAGVLSTDTAPQPAVTVRSTNGEVPVLRPKAVDEETKVRKLRSGKYVVTLRSATRFANMLDLNNWNARVQFYEQLRRQGVIDALEKAGIKPGDIYVAGKHEMEWE